MKSATRSVLLGFAFLTFVSPLFASTISGVVKDQSGAVIPGAQIEIRGGDLQEPVQITSDGLGRFVSPEVKPGRYILRVRHEGFEELEQLVDVFEPVQLELTLAIARQQAEISVPAQALAFANSDPVYKELRSVGIAESFRIENFNLIYDVATLEFRNGTLPSLAP